MLFAANCMSCHQTPESLPKNLSASQIETAVTTNPAMSSVRSIPKADLEAISNFIAESSDATPPETPRNLMGVAVNDSLIHISWSRSSDQGGSGLKGYKISRNDALISDFISAQDTTYSDTGLQPSSDYRYKIVAVDNAGNESPPSADVLVSTLARLSLADSVPPTAPTSLTLAVKSYSQIDLSWSASTDSGGSGLTNYKIYRDGVLINTISSANLNYADVGLSAGKSYSYKVSAVDGKGNESPVSAIVIGVTTAIDTANLFKVKCLTCHAETDPKIRNKDSNAIKNAISTVGSMKSIVLTQQEVEAIALYNSDASDTTAPEMPKSFVASAVNDTTVQISWGTSTDTGRSGLKGYKLYRDGVIINGGLLASATSYSDTGLKEKTTYKYKLVAFDKGGNDSAATTEKAVLTAAKVLEDTTPPTQPTGIAASVKSYSQIDLSWSASTDSGGSGLTNYKIYRDGVLINTISSANLNYADVGLSAGKSYSYKVSAVDGKGNESPVSAIVIGVTTAIDTANLFKVKCLTCHAETDPKIRNKDSNAIKNAISTVGSMKSIVLTQQEVEAIALYNSDASDTTAPEMPKSFVASAVNDTTVQISWGTSTDTGRSGLKGYKLYRDGVIINGGLLASATSYSDTGLKEKTTYKYKLVAFDKGGNDSAATTEKAVLTAAKVLEDTTPPTQPTGLAASAKSYKEIALSWSASTDTGGSGLTQYKIYRDGKLISTQGAGTLTYSDVGLISGKSYSYKVSALDGKGNESILSAVVSGSTPKISGEDIYNNNCASCHQALARIPRSFNSSDISAAILSVGDMKSRFSFKNGTQDVVALSQEELDALASYIGSDALDGSAGVDSAGYSNYQTPIGTADYVAGFLRRTFGTSAQVEAIATTISKNTSTLGGGCSRYESENCVLPSLSYEVFPSPESSTTRAGVVINGCAQVLNIPAATTQALTNAGLTVNSAADYGNMAKVYSLFYPGQPVGNYILDSMISVQQAGYIRTKNLGQSWALVLLPLCENALMEGF